MNAMYFRHCFNAVTSPRKRYHVIVCAVRTMVSIDFVISMNLPWRCKDTLTLMSLSAMVLWQFAVVDFKKIQNTKACSFIHQQHIQHVCLQSAIRERMFDVCVWWICMATKMSVSLHLLMLWCQGKATIVRSIMPDFLWECLLIQQELPADCWPFMRHPASILAILAFFVYPMSASFTSSFDANESC